MPMHGMDTSNPNESESTLLTNYNSEELSKPQGKLLISMALSELVIDIRGRGRNSVASVFPQRLETSPQIHATPGHSHFSGTVVSHGRKKSLELLKLFSMLCIMRACGGDGKS